MSVPLRRLGRPPALVSVETRQRILAAARHTFARRGYDGTTNKQIAADVGITTGAVYHYFESKADLYVAVYAETQRIAYDAFECGLAAAESFVERVVAILDVSARLAEIEPALGGFVAGVPVEAHRHDELRERLRPLQTRADQFMRRVVDDAVARGELAPGVAAEAARDLLVALLMGLSARSFALHDAERHRRTIAAATLMVQGNLVR